MPGKTKIKVQSEATEQFLADTHTIDYEQKKELSLLILLIKASYYQMIN